jgi:hypothetical protein
MDVDPEAIRQAKIQIGNSTQETDAALTAFVTELQSFGECWGDDDLGSLIGLSYQGIYEVAMDCFAHNLDLIDDYAERLGAAAENIERSDAESAAQTSAIPTDLPNLPL